MLFNSYVFVLAFLPVTLFFFFVIGKWAGARAAGVWLTLASLFFYGWWNPRYLVLILISIVINYWFGVGINNARRGNLSLSPKHLLALGVILNLGLLSYYKYANFFIANYDSLSGANWNLPNIVLPLAISFFTFTQIAYLVDAYHGVTEAYDFLYYALFVSFFPHLIAGPIVSYRRLMPQFAEKTNSIFDPRNMAEGLSLFTVGLSKKVLIADNLSSLSVVGFDRATPDTFGIAWMGALGYTFQLYFDFSAYSDMAIGLGRMFNVRFPLNFNSPYKAQDISDFWRRWHITLSQFLRDHLYIPLGGNRRGEPNRYLNLMITMLLGGLWHGAAWTFVLWGALHGCYLVIHHLFQVLCRGMAWVENRRMARVWQPLTFVSVVIGWVIFRAHSVHQALTILATMFCLHRPTISHVVATAGISGNGGEGSVVVPPKVSMFTHIIYSPNIPGIEMMCIAALIAFAAPNAQQLFCIAETTGKGTAVAPLPLWKPSLSWALIVASLLIICLLNMANLSEFLYFKF